MGHYNVCCSISSISICGGTEVAYIPLEVYKYSNRIGDGNNILIYRHCFYTPVTLPIFGLYDSYGGIEDIEENYNTETLEKHFKTKIRDVISLTKMKKPITSGMFIHREIYDFIVKNLIDDYGKIKGRAEHNFGDSPEALFIKHQKSLLESKKTKKEDIKLWKTFPQSVENQTILKRIKRQKYWEGLYIESSIFQFREYGRFNNIYQPQMLKGRLKKELIDFVLFEMNMYAVNRFYFPAMNGWQDGNKYANRKLYRKCTKIINKEIAEYE